MDVFYELGPAEALQEKDVDVKTLVAKTRIQLEG